MSRQADQQPTEQLPGLTTSVGETRQLGAVPSPAPDRVGSLVRHLGSALVGAAILAAVLLIASVNDDPGDDMAAENGRDGGLPGLEVSTGTSAPQTSDTIPASPSVNRSESQAAMASLATLPSEARPLTLGPHELELEAGKEEKVEVLDDDEPSPDTEFDERTLTIVRPPEHASEWRVHNDHIHVEAREDYVGPDSIVYRVCDTGGRCGTGEIRISTTE